MSGTARTTSYLLNSEFQDGQAAGSITPSRVRDVIATFDSRAPISVMQYGAVGNGASNPASGFYSTLAALQAVYPFATALTNEMDWLAHQAAINALTNGGVIYSPPLSFVFSNSHSASDGSGTLTFPQATTSAPGTGVSWLGSYPGTVLNWPSDLGTGKFAVLCGGRANSSCVGFFEGLRFVGPGVGSTLGASTCNMQGIGTNDRRSIKRVYVSGFWSGINLVGGQCFHEDVLVSGCYYGYYWDAPNADGFGNMQFIRVLSQVNNMAGIGVNHQAVIGGTQFNVCFFGAQPFGIYKETNNGSPAVQSVVTTSTFQACQFENTGNAAIGDDTTSDTGRIAILYQTRFYNCQFMWDNFDGQNFHLTSRAQYALFDIGTFAEVTIDGIQNPEQMIPGTLSIFNASYSVNGFTLRGDISQLISNCTGATAPAVNVMFSGSWNWGLSIVEDIHNNRWSGFVVSVADGSAAGSVMIEYVGTPNGIVAKASTGAVSDTPLGVLMYTSSSGFGLLANHGNVTVKTTGGTLTSGQWLRTAASGEAVAASGSNDTTTPLIGITTLPNTGSTVGVLLNRCG